MRRLPLLLLVVVVVAATICACDRQRQTGDDNNENAASTTPCDDETADSDDDDDDTAMPVAADELFDDFIFNFISSPRQQMSRITFPLVHYKSSRRDTITRSAWEMESFFAEQDYYTVLLDNERQMERMRDTTITHAVVEKIYLHSGYVTQYIFDRQRGKWRLTALCDTTFLGTYNESFLRFYDRFSADTLFQVSAVNDPLAFVGPDPDDDFRTMEGSLVPEQWRTFAPDLPREMIYNIVYGTPAQSTREKLFVVMGIANGMEVDLTFRQREGKWKLVQLTM